jgi:hypothetical protein
MGAWTAEIPIHAPQKGACEYWAIPGPRKRLALRLSSGPTKPPKKRKDFPMNGPVRASVPLSRTVPSQYGKLTGLSSGGEKEAGMDQNQHSE